MKAIKTTRTERVGEVPGAFGRKHGVDGLTETANDLSTANIVVTYNEHGTPITRALCMLHENGHVDVAQVLANEIGEDAFPTLVETPLWNVEVEAWMHGMESLPIPSAGMNGTNGRGYEFVLDALNSYRRTLGVSDEQWHDAIDGLAAYYDGDPADLHNYVPLEPDPGDEPPRCTPQFGHGEEDPEESEDDGQADQPDDGEDEPQGSDEDLDGDAEDDAEDEAQPEPEGDDEDAEPGEGDAEPTVVTVTDGSMDARWMSQDVLDALAEGRPAAEVAAENGLDVNRMPPLAKAMAIA